MKSKKVKEKKKKINLDELVPAEVVRVPGKRKIQWQAYLWLAPAVVLLVVFNLIPPVMSLITSFFESDGVTMTKFVWFDNYAATIGGSIFWHSLGNVFLITIVTFIFTHVANLLLAELVVTLRWKKLSAFYRVMLIIPIVVPGVVGLMISQYIMFAPEENSIWNMIIGLFGAEPSMWFFHEDTALLTVLIMGFPWGGGTTMLIYIASLQGISTEMIEATKLDGVGPFRRVLFFHLPLMIGQIKYFVITSIIGGMQNFTVQLIITKPTEATPSTMVPGMLIYNHAFLNSDYGMANAVGILLFLIILGLTVINNKFIQNKNSEEA